MTPRLFVLLFVAGLLVLGILAIACGDNGDGNDEATALVILGGVPIPEEGPPTQGGFALEGEDALGEQAVRVWVEICGERAESLERDDAAWPHVRL